MAISEAIVNKIKVLLYENKEEDAKQVLMEEANLLEADANDYIQRLRLALTPTSNSSKPVSKVLIYGFLVMGILFLALTGYLVKVKNDQLANSVLIEGKVIKLIEDDELYAPVIVYELNGESRQYTSSVYSQPPAFELNESVEIYVNIADPREVVINSFFNKYLAAFVLGVFAIIFLFIGVLMLVIKPSSNHSAIDLFDRDEERLVSFDD